jgi:serine/threonine protein kinase KIN1/2
MEGILCSSLSRSFVVSTHLLPTKATKYASKEAGTLREAALSMLLHYPYICTRYEMIVHQHHYYMLSEYVSNVQMLDYIIGHGRLKE